MSKKIVITGATGLIGTNLCKALIKRGDELTIFSTNIQIAKKRIPGAKEYFEWDYNYPGDWEYLLNNKDAIIHLAGANLIAKKWTEKYKKILEDSRIESANSIFHAVENISIRPKIFISPSGVNYYADSGNELLDESNEPGHDYLAELCKKWEDVSAKFSAIGLRNVSVRTGIVLSEDSVIIKIMKIPFKIYLGGYIGRGSQWLPWIHIDDIVNIYIYALENENIFGPVNGTSPNPVPMKEFCKTFGEVLNRPSFISMPRFPLKLIYGEKIESITSSLRVIPNKLIAKRFDFKYPTLKPALENIFQKN